VNQVAAGHGAVRPGRRSSGPARCRALNPARGSAVPMSAVTRPARQPGTRADARIAG